MPCSRSSSFFNSVTFPKIAWRDFYFLIEENTNIEFITDLMFLRFYFSWFLVWTFCYFLLLRSSFSTIPVFRDTLDFKYWIFVPYFCYALKRLTGHPVQGFWTKYYPKGGDFGQNPQGLSLHGVTGQFTFALSKAWSDDFCHFLGYHLFFISPVFWWASAGTK